MARDRAAALRLSTPQASTPARLVAWLGAVQSQDYPFGKWSIAQRLTKANADVEKAVASGTILRTHILRPTWHFVARDDLRWMQALSAPRIRAQMRYNDRRNGMDAASVASAVKTIAGAIARRGHLTRSEVADVLRRAGVKRDPWLVGHLLMHAELDVVVCSGVPRGKQQTYALVDERAPRASSMTRDESLAALARRYFQSHGPATARDFQWWSGLAGVDVVRSLEILGRAVTRVPCGDRTYVVSSDAAATARRAGSTVQVIQTYDELVVAYSESRAVVDVSGAARGSTGGGSALLTRGIVRDGQIIGRWTFRNGNGPRAIALEPFRRLSSVERAAIAEAGARFERFYFA